jgi:hypothetical protein
MATDIRNIKTVVFDILFFVLSFLYDVLSGFIYALPSPRWAYHIHTLCVVVLFFSTFVNITYTPICGDDGYYRRSQQTERAGTSVATRRDLGPLPPHASTLVVGT